MRRMVLLALGQFGLLAGAGVCADFITLKDGGHVSGLVESGNTQELHIKVADRSQTIDIHQIQAIQFGDSKATPAASSPKPAASESGAEVNSLFLKDGTHVTGRWWSIDAANVHFLIDNQLQNYSRSEVVGVSFTGGALPAPSATPTSPASPPLPPTTPAKPPSAQPPANAAPPARAPAAPRPSTAPPPQPPAPARPSGGTAAAGPARGQSHPNEIGMVYSWNGKVVIPLERNRAVEHGSGSSQYWEMAGPRSSLRLNEDTTLVFVVGLPPGVDPASYSLFLLETVDGNRRTRSQQGRRAGPATWPVEIVKQNEASINTYVFTVRDLPAGEYSFSPSSSNDGYCFGVDPAPGQ